MEQSFKQFDHSTTFPIDFEINVLSMRSQGEIGFFFQPNGRSVATLSALGLRAFLDKVRLRFGVRL